MYRITMYIITIYQPLVSPSHELLFVQEWQRQMATQINAIAENKVAEAIARVHREERTEFVVRVFCGFSGTILIDVQALKRELEEQMSALAQDNGNASRSSPLKLRLWILQR